MATRTELPVEFAENWKFGLSDSVALLGIISPFPKFNHFLRFNY